jgi:hypothetical protein
VLFFTFCDDSVQNGPQFFGIGDGTADFAYLAQDFLRLNPGLLGL